MIVSQTHTRLLNRIKIVLVNTSHPGNIGATARAMANMGLTKLVLVQPLEYPSMQATARAAGADDILDDAELFPSLAKAVADCSHVYGTTARLRSITWPEYTPQELAEQVRKSDGDQDIALVFGRERSGLTNEELDLCQALVHIPVDDRHSSLNLASAVMVVAFSIRSALLVADTRDPTIGKKHASPVATSEQIQFYFNALDTLLNKISFYKGNATRVMRKLRRLYYKAEPSQEDVRILLGTISAINAELEKGEKAS
ncbi:MAG: RNA methyltransferase [Desulfobacterales bacterium]|nr:RNA methyltransferase [Desulfobacterales bacterium]